MAGMKNQIILTGHKIQALIIDALKLSQPIIIGTAKTIQALTDSLRDLAPILIAAGTALTIWHLNLVRADIAAKGLAASTMFLSKALKFLSAHPVFAAITALIAGWTAIKAITDALNVSNEEKLSLINREIDDLRKLQFLMLDANRTDEDKLKILADYAKDYPKFLTLLEKEALTQKELNDAIKEGEELKQQARLSVKKDILSQKILREQQLLQSLEKMKNIKGEIQWVFKIPAKRIKSKIKGIREEIRGLMAELAIMEGRGPEIKGEIPGFEWTIDMEKALKKMEYERKSALEKARDDYLEELAIFKLTEQAKTDETEKQNRARILAEERYQKAIKKINDDAAEEMRKIRERAEQEGLKDTRRKLEEANRLLAHEEEIAKALLDIEKEYTDKEWELRKAAMKAHFDDEDDYRQWLGEEEFKREKQRLADLIKEWEKHYEKLKKLGTEYSAEDLANIARHIEKLKELKLTPPIIYDPGDFAAGAKKGWKEATKDLTDEYKIWEDATEGTAQAMSDTLSDVFFDGMKNELKSASDYWRAFTNTVKRYIADIAAAWILFGSGKSGGWEGLIGLGASLLLGGGGGAKTTTPTVTYAHLGGLQRVKGMHTGGLASNEMLCVLKDKEFEIRDTSVNRMTLPVLDFINRTGRVPQTQTASVYNNYYYVDAIDPESFDKVLRDRGSAAIHDISLGSFAYARNKRDRRVV
jgi:hypothetical protein